MTFKDDLQSYDPDAVRAVEVIWAVFGVAAAVVFIVWLRRVRAIAERLTKAPHRHGRGWVVGSWFVPVIAFWYPKQIVDDVIAASDPRTPPHAEELPPLRLKVVTIWWATWIAGNVIEFADPGFFADQPSARDLLTQTLAITASSVLTVVCAVYAVRVIRLITDLQASRPQVAWWETADTRLG
ncbi:DUF4328 domain-containing protein [Kribbella sp. CA-294648]|uniref:DUF4328 domain-containing protein n=1 Tax=Kribbella sp. CA-294648 TaxID=3239948 RepID=UPI003D8AB5D3